MCLARSVPLHCFHDCSPQNGVILAQILFHRFYTQVSMKEFDTNLTIMSSVFLASKLEEHTRRLTDIINVFYRIFQVYADKVDQIPFSVHSLKNEVVEVEKEILASLGFTLTYDNPHKFMMMYLNTIDSDSKFAQKAWNYLNDSFFTDLPLQYGPNVLASGAIYCANIELEHGLSDSPPWYELFDVTKLQLVDFKKQMDTFCETKNVEYQEFYAKNSIQGILPHSTSKRKRSPSDSSQTVKK
jgi:hypothetical protein